MLLCLFQHHKNILTQHAPGCLADLLHLLLQLSSNGHANCVAKLLQMVRNMAARLEAGVRHPNAGRVPLHR